MNKRPNDDPPVLGYARSLSGISWRGWIRLQRIKLPLPNRCCTCLGEATERWVWKTMWADIALPFCTRCRRRAGLRWRRYWITTVIIWALLAAIINVVEFQLIRFDHPWFTRWSALANLALHGAVVGTAVGYLMCGPVACLPWTRQRVYVRFHNRAYLDYLVSSGTVMDAPLRW